MASTSDFTTDTAHHHSINDWTSEFPYRNASWNRQNIDFNLYLNQSFFPMNCPSAGPNNLGRYISMILYTVVCVIGLFGNSLVI